MTGDERRVTVTRQSVFDALASGRVTWWPQTSANDQQIQRGEAHCTTCHTTFTVVSAFDKHRRNDACLDPTEAGLVLTDRNYECWGFPGREEEN